MPQNATRVDSRLISVAAVLAVVAAASGEACLEALQSQSFDVLLLDVWLPVMDGLETLQKIRALEPRP